MKYKTIIFNSTAFVILALVIAGIVFIKTRTKIGYIHNVVTPVSLPQLLQWTDIVIIGTVTDTNSLKIPASIPGRNRIMTDATVKVDEYVLNRHGNTPSQVIVRYEGGTFGNEQVIIDESDELLLGEHVLLFLTERNDSLYDLAAARFAKYTIQRGRLRLSNIDKNRLKLLINTESISLDDLKSKIENLNISRQAIPQSSEPIFMPSPH